MPLFIYLNFPTSSLSNTYQYHHATCYARHAIDSLRSLQYKNELIIKRRTDRARDVRLQVRTNPFLKPLITTSFLTSSARPRSSPRS